MGTFQVEFKPDDLPETRAMDRRVRGLLEDVLAVGLPDDFGELLALSFAQRTYADTFVCLDVEECCATLSASASHLLAGSACIDDTVLAACTPETPVARGVRTRPERRTRAGRLIGTESAELTPGSRRPVRVSVHLPSLAQVVAPRPACRSDQWRHA